MTMRGRRPKPFELTSEAERILRRIANNGARPFVSVVRARILLARAAGERVKNIARRFGVDESVVWRATNGFERYGFKSLEPKSMPSEFAVPATLQVFVDRPNPVPSDDDLHEIDVQGIDWG
ncbi:MAG: hypothetical protein C0483_07575 [Pirellula sp.]|nr:hypothetical protein [Pirellula sp.]